MKSLFFSLLVLIIPFHAIWSQEIHHHLSMPEPQTHYFHVEIELTDFEEESLTLSLPTWTPGSYLIREFSKHLNVVKAKNEKGEPLPIEKTRKNKWKITKGKAEKVIVNYEVYAFELTVRTSFLDLTHGYLNGTNVFMYPEGYKDLGGRLTVYPHETFEKVTTAMPIAAEGVANDDSPFVYEFEDFDHLVDCPIEIGNQEEFSFEAAGVKHHVAMYGVGNYDVEQLKVDMAKIVEASTAIFGENPNEEYWFIIHNTENGGGGLEHRNSTTLGVKRWTYEGSSYLKFLSLVAHEYFHLWNVKRLRAKALGPFDYDGENYTDLLWVMEGFTSYYDELILRRAGFYSNAQYLNRLKSTLNYVESTPGNQVQPIAHASFDAWIKAYRPNENSYNTTISYYSKGHLVTAVLDAMMMKKYKGKKGMDDFLTLMYNKYYKEKDSGFTAEELKAELEDFIKTDLTTFFEKHIYGTETIDYANYFKEIGLTVKKEEFEYTSLGVSTAEEEGKLMIKRVLSDSPAENAGLSPNDEIIAFNGFRVDKSSLDEYIDTAPIDSDFVLIISRDQVLRVINVNLSPMNKVRYDFEFDESNKIGKYWLREQL